MILMRTSDSLALLVQRENETREGPGFESRSDLFICILSHL